MPSEERNRLGYSTSREKTFLLAALWTMSLVATSIAAFYYADEIKEFLSESLGGASNAGLKENLQSSTSLAAIMRHEARFCTSG
jgi:hypothetical protein